MGEALGLMLRKRVCGDGPLTDDQLDRLAADAGLTIKDSFLPGILEVTAAGKLFLAIGISRAWRRWLIPHGVTHQMCDAGNQAHLYRADSLTLLRQERRAEVVAGWVHFASYVEEREELVAWEMAEWADVPEECVQRWLVLVECAIAEARNRRN